MQSSSRSLSFKQGLAGASPATDARWLNANCSQGVTVLHAALRRRRLVVQFHVRAPVSKPLCLSSYRASFVNSYSSVQVRPGAPFHGDHDVTAASRPVTAFVPVRIRLVTPISPSYGEKTEMHLRVPLLEIV